MAEIENSMNSDHRSETAPPARKRRNQPGMPDLDAEVVALSPETLMATNRFVCDVCNRGFQRDQNLQLHRRGHNLPWKLRVRSENEVIRKRVYVCPEIACAHHHPSRALGDLTGIKKHFCRKHGEKKYRCERCNKVYAVESDRKAHMKICGMKEYPCDCGTLFSRRDSFIAHRAYCEAMAQESVRPQPRSGGTRKGGGFEPPSPSLSTAASSDPPLLTPSSGVLSPTLSLQTSAELTTEINQTASAIQPPRRAASLASTMATATSTDHIPMSNRGLFPNIFNAPTSSSSSPSASFLQPIDPISLSLYTPSLFQPASQNPRSPALSATALLQKAAEIGSTSSTPLLHRLWPPSHPASHENESMASGLGLGLPSGGSNSSFGKLMMSDSELFGNKPMTLDFLRLGMGGGEASSSGFSAFLDSIDGRLDMAAPPPYAAGETWDKPSKRKHSLL